MVARAVAASEKAQAETNKAVAANTAAIAEESARAQAAEAANKKDIMLLKKLCAEFRDELDALGAKTDKIDKRVSKLEKGIGTWKISGRFKFDVKEMNSTNAGAQTWGNNGSHEWNRDYARMFFRRQINETTYFDSQFRLGSAWAGDSQAGVNDGSAFSTRKFYVSTKLPFWGLNAKIGRWQFDWEDYYGLYTDEDAFFGDWRVDGFWFEKSWKTVKLDVVAGRGNSGSRRFYADNSKEKTNHQLYAVNLKWTPNDKFTGGIMAYWQNGDGAEANWASSKSIGNAHTYGVTAGYKFTPNIALKGIYYWQKYSSSANAGVDDNNYAFKAILDIKQPVLKFTDLWIEYAQFKNGFGANNGANGQVNCWSMGGVNTEPGIMWSRPINNETTKTWFILANQKWTKKWSTFIRFQHGNFGTAGVDNAYEWGLGVKYKLNPAITFMLAYDQISYGDRTNECAAAVGSATDWSGAKDKVVFFQTDVKF